MIHNIIYGLFGLLFGSFSNVLIQRIPKGEDFAFSRSRCPNCHTTLSAKDLVPVLSYIVLRGKCSYCKAHISPQYPIIELMVGLIFLFCSFHFTTPGLQLYFSLYFTMLLCLFIIDYRHYILPDTINIALAGLSIYPLFFMENTVSLSNIWIHFIPALVLYGIRGIGNFIYKQDTLGLGDIKLFIALGLNGSALLTAYTLMGAIFLGGLASAFIILFGLKNRKAHIPFGPFIITSHVLLLLSPTLVDKLNHHFLLASNIIATHITGIA